MNYSNILVIQTAFIGDAILASSLLEKLYKQFPQSKISILVRAGNESIYDAHPFLKEVLIWNKKEKKLRHLFQLLLQVRKNKYDCVINCHRYASSGFLTGLSGAKHTAGFKQNPFSFLFNHTVKHRFQKDLHEINRYHDLVSDFAGPGVSLPKLYPSEKDVQAVLPYTQLPYVCIAPASVWFTKQLPKEKWIALCNQQNSQHSIFLLGAAGDIKLCEEIKNGSTHTTIVNLSGKLSLLQSCALMKGAEMNYVNDSAPLHLASSVNAPVTAFFLSTVPDFGFGPLSSQQQIVEVEGLNCRPCGLHGYKACPKEHFNCGFHIDLNL